MWIGEDAISWRGRNEHKMQDPFGGDDIHVHFPAGGFVFKEMEPRNYM